MSRPLLYKTELELSRMVAEADSDRATLELVLAELERRRDTAARTLEEQVRAMLAGLRGSTGSARATRMDDPRVLYTGKYDEVHREAMAAGSPVALRWKYRHARFRVGPASPNRNTGAAYAAIWRIAQNAGREGIAAADLVTRMREDQAGNPRSEYCQGLPPIGWAEGWIDTAVQRGHVVLVHQDDRRQQAAETMPELPGLGSNPSRAAQTGGKRGAANTPKGEDDARMSPEQHVQTQEAVAQLRRKLIDLSRRNPLVSFKHGGRAAAVVRIVDERPDLVHEALNNGGSLQFEPLPGEETTPKDETTPEFRIAYERARLTDEEFIAATESLGDDERDVEQWEKAERALRTRVRASLGLPELDYGKGLDVLALARAHGFDPSHELREGDDDIPDHQRDSRLRVLLVRKELEKRLKAIYDRYRSHERETGVHTLFLAQGFVEWRDQEAGSAPHLAPVLLQAVTLERQLVKGRAEFSLRPHEDGLQVNVALAERLKQPDFGVELPSLRENETPESYFVRLRQRLGLDRNLKLRTFMTLAILPFHRMILWKDLDPAVWPDDAFGSHRLLPALLGVAPMPGDSSGPEKFDIDDPSMAEKVPALICLADESQHSAIIDVARGRDLAVEGPPGTGKSQTITNMIATALEAGRRVLFVAEKQAALRVVSDRLKEAGLGALLLELHGENARRDEVYKALRARLDERPRANLQALTRARDELAAHRAMLRRYLALISTPLGALGRTAYATLWSRNRLREKIPRKVIDDLAAHAADPDPLSVTPARLARVRSRFEVFALALEKAGLANEGSDRTRWLAADTLPAFDQARELALAAAAGRAARAVHEAGVALGTALPVALPDPQEPLEAALLQLGDLPALDCHSEDTLRAALKAPATARALLRQQTRWRQIAGTLAQDLADPENVTKGATERLASCLQAVERPPATLAAARAELADCRNAATLLTDSREGAVALDALFDLPAAMTVKDRLTVCRVLARLKERPVTEKALLGGHLLEPLVEVGAAWEATRAEELIAERKALQKRVNEDGFELDPNELRELADILDQTSFFGRIGTRFRVARKRSAQILREAAERTDMAEQLRHLSRHLKAAAHFNSESPARRWFPAVLWQGAGSDFASLLAARETLAQAQQELTAAGRPALLTAWLAMSAKERDQAGQLARNLVPPLESLMTVNLANLAVKSASDTLATRTSKLHDLVTALEAVMAVEEAPLVREGETLPLRLHGLLAAADQFDQLRGDPLFVSIGTIDQPLDELVRALAFVDALEACEDDTLGLHGQLAQSHSPVAAWKAFAAAAPACITALTDWQEAQAALNAATGIDPAVLVSPDAAAQPWATIGDILEAMAMDEAGARVAADVLRYETELQEDGQETLAKAAIAGEVDARHLADLYELAVVEAILNHYFQQDGRELTRLGGLTLARAREDFVATDKQLHKLEAQRIVGARLTDRVPEGIGHGPKSQWTDLALLRHELGLTRPRTPLRDVVHRAGQALQALKPVWMMSPASAAQYIRSGTLDFDLLVIDEASQMRPEYAVSALLRSDQVVVVGDANQLPPSDHFQVAANGDEDGEDDFAIDAGTESILDLANQRFRAKRRLRCAYRFQHERLINFSNREFYENDLVVFPSPRADADELLGVHYIHVPSRQPETFYESSINEAEAKEVINEACRLMLTYPDHSLGIATMNARQAELIRNEFERLEVEQPDVRSYVQMWEDTTESFFVKNLENVQGDERDIILMSTVFGPGRDGVVRQQFGPMSRDVGWRRLNVLVTRARISARVFTSLWPNDIKITDSTSKGPRALQAYLTYAMGGATADNPLGGEPDSDFEVFVKERLEAAGYEVVPQVGVDRFRIDLGIRHKDCAGGFIAGIECDGASYHSGMTVRDRDRIRQAQLESLGWHIYRVWSIDWFANPDRETEHLLAWLARHRDAAIARFPVLTPEPSPGEAPGATEPGLLKTEPAASPDPELDGSLPSGSDTPVTPEGPVGKAKTPIDGIDWFEEIPGKFYTVWPGGNYAGDVTVLSRPTTVAGIYRGQLRAPKPEYEGRVEATDETFKTHDIYQAVREVVRRATAATEQPDQRNS